MSDLAPEALPCANHTPDTHVTVASLTRRQNNFNVLRVLLAVSVIFSHSYPILYGIQVLDPIARFFRYQKDVPEDHAIDLGHLALYGFFAISGYLVTMSWQNKRSIGDYFKKRILRIYPGLLVVVVLDMFIVSPLGAENAAHFWHALHVTSPLLYLNLLSLNSVQPPVFIHAPVAGSVNGSLWSIRLEFNCYLMVAALGMAAASLRRWIPRVIFRVLPLLLLALFYTVYCLCCSSHLAAFTAMINIHPASHIGHILTKLGSGQGLIPRMVLYFICGMCLYLYREVVSYNRVLALAALAILLASIYVLPVVAYTLPFVGVYLLFYVAFRPSRLAGFGTRTDLSYGLYLYAFPIQQLLTLYFRPHLNVLLLFLSALVITSGLAYLSWHFVEQPSLRLKQRLLLPRWAVPRWPWRLGKHT